MRVRLGMAPKITTLVSTIEDAIISPAVRYGHAVSAVASQAVVFGVLPTLICQWPVVSRIVLKAGRGI